MSAQRQLQQKIKMLAAEAGFARSGVAPIDPPADGERFVQWLAKNHGGGMQYLARNVDVRLDPRKLLDGARSVICLAWAYDKRDCPSGLFARYARGADYHQTLKQLCRGLMDQIRLIAPHFRGRAFVDSAPLLERSLAARAGLGVIGANGCLIVPGVGSYVLLAEIVSNLDLPADEPLEPACQQCGRCIRACPTNAFDPDGMLDARRCLSYLTIEHKGPMDPGRIEKITRIAGCDICQEVCPHNAGACQASPGPANAVESATLGDIINWRSDDWATKSAGTAVARLSYEMLMRNAVIVAANAGRGDLTNRIRDLEPVVGSEIVEWALRKLGGAQ
jgi:epoxyqueuosine reductase